MKTKRQNLPSFFTGSVALLVILLLVITSCQSEPLVPTGEDEFGKHVRTTEARTPAEEQAGFSLPPGFEIQLFASEPDIGKPLNMAFDLKGRMWLTQSYEYPFPDTSGHPKDKITILEDTDQDGKADKFITFADSLNIPIGITTVPDGAIAYSIPSITHFIDKDGDDKVDERKVLYSGFRYEDTHGMINNLERHWDGWIHADHGFSNISRVAGTDGDTIVMNSGNTFRFREDGSRVEFTTTGRVNPYGYGFDELGYTYSADCHSSPIYQLVRGADYPHFGKKPTGIGFGPALMSHDYGSTALAGLAYYLGDQYPEAYQNSFYLGDVVKCRVYRSTMTMQGTTPVVKWEPDFVVSDDPWFRPVDVKLGPDGAIYIADFYNRIIGHYEVPLDHPGRDRQRGRIWRITYKGQSAPKTDWSKASLSELIAGLDNPNLPLRIAIANQIVDQFSPEAETPLKQLIAENKATAHQYVQGLWILFRLNKLSDDILTTALKSQDVHVQVHALRIMFELSPLNQGLVNQALEMLNSDNPHLQRQAVMVLSQNPNGNQVEPLLNLNKKVPDADSHLKYSIKQSLRDHFRQQAILRESLSKQWTDDDAKVIASVMVGVDEVDAAKFLLQFIGKNKVEQADLENYAKHTARFLPDNEQNALIALLQHPGSNTQNQQYQYFKSVEEGLAQAGKKLGIQGQAWAGNLAKSFLELAISQNDQWQIMPNPHMAYQRTPWRIVHQKSINADLDMEWLSSGAMDNNGGEVSVMISPAFEVPAALSFYLSGIKNEPEDPAALSPPANKIELVVSETGQTIKEEWITLPQEERQVQWDVSAYQGKRAFLRITDGSNLWGEFIAIGKIEPEVVAFPKNSPDELADKLIFSGQVAQTYKLNELAPMLNTLLLDDFADIYARNAAAAALLGMNVQKYLPAVANILKDTSASMVLKDQLAITASKLDDVSAATLLTHHLADLSYPRQKEVVLALSNNKTGLNELMKATEKGFVPPRILLEKQVSAQILPKLDKGQKAAFEKATANIKPPSASIDQLISERLTAFRLSPGQIAQGSAIFTQNCAICHQMNGQGANIGPQLDGIGNWGNRALAEKILDPNRNISKAFRTYTILLKDGKALSGLFRREEGQLLVFADLTGKEFTVDKEKVAEQKPSPFTLMPDNFSNVLSEADFSDLLAFLLNEK